MSKRRKRTTKKELQEEYDRLFVEHQNLLRRMYEVYEHNNMWKLNDELQKENGRLHMTSGYWTDLKLWQRIILSPLYALVFFGMCLKGTRIAVRELGKDER